MSKEKQYNRDSSKRKGPHGPFGGPFGMPGEKAKNAKQTTRRLMKYLGPHLWLMIGIIFFSIIVTLIGVIAPDFLRQIINSLQQFIKGTAD
jgi:ATP-binding cassette subfamily B protein